jgi:hypothetical protein
MVQPWLVISNVREQAPLAFDWVGAVGAMGLRILVKAIVARTTPLKMSRPTIANIGLVLSIFLMIDFLGVSVG